MPWHCSKSYTMDSKEQVGRSIMVQAAISVFLWVPYDFKWC